MSGRLTIALVTLGLIIGSASAAAQSQIVLGGSTTAVTFMGTGTSSTLAVTLGGCTISGSCSIGGTAFGTGSLTSGPAPYAITSMLGTITLTLMNAAAGQWSFSSLAPVGFSYGSGGSLLTGNVTLDQLSQAPGSSVATATATLAVTGGSLSSAISQGLVDVVIRFNSSTNLESLLGTTNKLKGKISSGAITPTPEPSSILLLGSGLLAAGSMLRFRTRNKHSN